MTTQGWIEFVSLAVPFGMALSKLIAVTWGKLNSHPSEHHE